MNLGADEKKGRASLTLKEPRILPMTDMERSL